MAPLRVGIIGLSAQGSWASRAHLPYLQATDKYTITALCNSSENAARAAIAAHSLPESTKAYGTPSALAADKDIDLVVCSVRVDRHYETIKPALEAGRDCFVEWPLASNPAQATELLELAKASGSRVMVGLQSQMSPAIRQLKELVASGRIGRVYNVSLVASGMIGGPVMPESGAYAAEKLVGGNLLTIVGGHTFDSLLFSLGELSALNAVLTIQQPTLDLVDAEGKVVRTVKRTSHDYVSLQGKLAGSGASFTAAVGGGQSVSGEPQQLWRIEGEKAVIELVNPGHLNLAAGNTLTIKYRDSDKVDPIDVTETDEFFKTLPHAAQLVGRLYDSFATGVKGNYPDWDWAVMRHGMIQAMYDSDESGRRTSYAYAW